MALTLRIIRRVGHSRKAPHHQKAIHNVRRNTVTATCYTPRGYHKFTTQTRYPTGREVLLNQHYRRRG